MNPEPTCKNLRAKTMFISTVNEPETDAHAGSCSHHCWCNCTLTEVGPDDRPVGGQICTPSRPCFEE